MRSIYTYQGFKQIQRLNGWVCCMLLVGMLPLFFSACVKQEKKAVEDMAITSLQTSLFVNSKQDEQVRTKAFAILKNTDKKDYATLSSLYSIIGKSYGNSFHFDSCIFYTELAHTIALKTNDKNLQAISRAQLLRFYCSSITYLQQRDSLFEIINGVDNKELLQQTQAMRLLVIGEYYLKTEVFDLALYNTRNALDMYNEYLHLNIPDREDSANIGMCYIQMGLAYSSINFIGDIKQAITTAEILNGLKYLQSARKWLYNNNAALSAYYMHTCTFSYALPVREKIRIAKTYKDSLLYLANTTGYNLNDWLKTANHYLCNVTYYASLKDSSYKPSDYWHYYHEAAKYNHDLINPIYALTFKWLEGALYQREGKCLQGLSILLPLKKQAGEVFTLNQQKFFIGDIIKCYQTLRNVDSVAFYYNQYFLINDSIANATLKKVTTEAEAKYQNQVKQEKLNTQNAVIQYGIKQKVRLFIGIGSLLCLAGLLIVGYRNKRRTTRKLDKQNAALNIVNQQLDIANQSKSKLFAIISHDLRGPITQLHHVLKLQEAKGEMLTLQKRLEYDQQIQFSTANLLESMEGLLSWSKTQLQEFTVAKFLVNVTKLVEQCINLMHPLIEEKHLQINNQIAANKTIIAETDANFLLAILRNILHNAIKASPNGSVIIIEYNSFSENNIAKDIKIINRGNPFTQQDYERVITETQTSEQLWRGLGLQVVDELSRKINTTVFFETTIDKNICCTITFNE